jgi:transcriptional regulator with XRE-family HTH domain
MADVAISVGPRTRVWRQTRGLSQFELAIRAGFSARHVSFIETGRAQPSREAVIALGQVLDLSLRERNRLLESAGFAQVFRETPLSSDEMAHMRGVLHFILDQHLPYPDIVVDRHWNFLLGNQAANQFFPTLISPALRARNRNILRATFHPEGTRRWIVNWAEVERHLLSRAEPDLGSVEDAVSAALLAEIKSYASASGAAGSHSHGRPGFAPVQHRHDFMHAARHHVAGTADRDVFPGRSRIRALLAEKFRSVCRNKMRRLLAHSRSPNPIANGPKSVSRLANVDRPGKRRRVLLTPRMSTQSRPRGAMAGTGLHGHLCPVTSSWPTELRSRTTSAATR